MCVLIMNFLKDMKRSFNIFYQKASWFLEIGWKLKDAEPSEGALIINRVIYFPSI